MQMALQVVLEELSMKYRGANSLIIIFRLSGKELVKGRISEGKS